MSVPLFNEANKAAFCALSASTAAGGPSAGGGGGGGPGGGGGGGAPPAGGAGTAAPALSKSAIEIPCQSTTKRTI